MRAVLVILAVVAPSSGAQEAERTDLGAAQCVACHGIGGISTNPMYPHLAGQRAGYLQRQLQAFHGGERYHPLMTPVAESLTAEEMSELARYYSRLPLSPATHRE